MQPLRHNPCMSMFKAPPILLLSLAFAMGTVVAPKALGQAVAQPIEVEYQPRSGDAWIDRYLADINRYAARYPQSFLDEMARYYSVSRAYAESLMQQPAWEPADVLMACALARTIAQPCREVVREWSRDHSEGWAGVARRMQDKPDTKQNRAIREQMEASYQRWARPLLD